MHWLKNKNKQIIQLLFTKKKNYLHEIRKICTRKINQFISHKKIHWTTQETYEYQNEWIKEKKR